ncbi:arsenite oxidase [Microbacterium gubbeenense]|uniref:arsenite oxidase n=1 Tax=Microbacterium gubbeenense TaxID=159896 RepID=UPI0012F74973|nr:arsenite oxidase [Microbacterium gubbeenense]
MQPVPVWGSAAAWREAHAAVWAHEPRELADDWVPDAWGVEADQTIVTSKSRGLAHLRREESVAVDPPDESAT